MLIFNVYLLVLMFAGAFWLITVVGELREQRGSTPSRATERPAHV